MDKEIAILKKQLLLNSEIKLSEYGIKPSSFFVSSKHNLEPLRKSRYIHNKYESYAWLFNGKTFGNYCRTLHTLTTEILTKVTNLIIYGRCSLAEIRSAIIAPLINDLNIIIDKEEGDRVKLENNSIIFNFKHSYELGLTATILINSINRIYDYRQSILIKLRYDLKSVIDNYEFQPEKFKRFVFYCIREPKDPIGTMGFCWNKNRNIIEDLVKFHTFLRDLNFIEKDTSIKLLKTGFGCEYLQEPLGIKWTKLVKGKSSKALLFHFIDELEHFNYINITEQNSELFKKIEYVFCDNQGEKFQNLDVSKSSWLNQRKTGRTPQEFQLDNIMYTINRSNQQSIS